MKSFIGLLLFCASITFSASTIAAEVDGLYYNTFGHPTDKAIVFVHGGPGYNSWSFENAVAADLAALGYYVVVYDQRGSGRSSAGLVSDFKFLKYISDLQTVIRKSQAVTPLLIGHSFGGTLALKFLATHPTQISGVLLLGAPVSWPDTVFSTLRSTAAAYAAAKNQAKVEETLLRLARMFPQGRTRGSYNFTVRDIGEMFNNAMATQLYSPKVRSQEATDLLLRLRNSSDAKWLGDNQPEPFLGFIQNENLYEINLLRDLSSRGHSIAAMYGDEDRLFDNVQLDQVKAALPRDHYWSIQGAAHSVFIDQKQAFIRALVLIAR